MDVAITDQAIAPVDFSQDYGYTRAKQDNYHVSWLYDLRSDTYPAWCDVEECSTSTSRFGGLEEAIAVATSLVTLKPVNNPLRVWTPDARRRDLLERMLWIFTMYAQFMAVGTKIEVTLFADMARVYLC